MVPIMESPTTGASPLSIRKGKLLIQCTAYMAHLTGRIPLIDFREDLSVVAELLLIEVDPQFGIHKAVKLIKGTTSRVLRQEFPWLRSRIPSLWTNSYFVSTVGGAPLSVIKQYIENQKNV